jgi:ubiquitin carboxyl-terminal hydrolase 25/28
MACCVADELTQDTGAWHPPKPTSDAEKPYQDPMHLFLDDLMHELLVLVHLRPASERRGSQIPGLPPSAIPVLFSALEAHECSYIVIIGPMIPN